MGYGNKLAIARTGVLSPIPLQRHFIDGRFEESRDGTTFTSLDPTTNAAIAEVADGKSEDIDAAVAAARRAFDSGPWPRLSAGDRAAVLRRIATELREHAEEFIELEVLDIGMPIAQMHGLAARAAQNFDYYAGVVTELHGRSFQVGDEFTQLHDPQAGRRRRPDHAVERAADALDLADRAGARGGQHGRPQAGRVVAADRDAAWPSCWRKPGCPRRVQRRARLRRDGRRAALTASRAST